MLALISGIQNKIKLYTSEYVESIINYYQPAHIHLELIWQVYRFFLIVRFLLQILYLNKYEVKDNGINKWEIITNNNIVSSYNSELFVPKSFC